MQASSLEEQRKVLNAYLSIVKKDNSALYDQIMSETYSVNPNTFAWREIITKNDAGEIVKREYALVDSAYGLASFAGNRVSYDDLFDKNKMEQAAVKAWDELSPSFMKKENQDVLINGGHFTKESTFKGYYQYTGNQILEGENSGNFSISEDQVNFGTDFKQISEEEAKEKAINSAWNKDNALQEWFQWKPEGVGVGSGYRGVSTQKGGLSSGVFDIIKTLINWAPEDGSSLPLHVLEALGEALPVLGTVLVQDQIPPIDKAIFAQVKHQFGNDFGVQAWYLRSVGDDTHSIAYAHGDHNDVDSFDQLANVIGLGATWRIGDNIRFSYDWGQNRTDFGRFMNGNTIYNHEMGTSDFDIAGRSNGSTPRFWVARVDIGKADTDKPGSWNAFADYKYFQHGSFFGGNGTEGVPDRYMDGIKSFTIGGGYVPAKDFLLEAFYTFGAKGIGQRDTLYGPEHFTLGDYTRIQMTYKF